MLLQLLIHKRFLKVNTKCSHEKKGSQSKEIDEWC